MSSSFISTHKKNELFCREGFEVKVLFKLPHWHRFVENRKCVSAVIFLLWQLTGLLGKTGAQQVIIKFQIDALAVQSPDSYSGPLTLEFLIWPNNYIYLYLHRTLYFILKILVLLKKWRKKRNETPFWLPFPVCWQTDSNKSKIVTNKMKKKKVTCECRQLIAGCCISSTVCWILLMRKLLWWDSHTHRWKI